MGPTRWRLHLLAGLICALGAPGAALGADSRPFALEHLTTADGLPQGTVYATLQDSQGFVWLGTEDGLVRYTGHELFRYGYSPAAHDGLPGNFIQAIVEDPQHDLWIAVVDGGLARWNRGSDSFTVFRHDPARADSLASDAVRALLLDGRGRLWIGSRDAGVDVLDRATGRVEHLRHDAARADSLIDDRVKTLLLDRSGTLWVGTEGGLDRLLPDGRSFAHYRHSASDRRSLGSDQITQLREDRDGSLWVATFAGGLNRIDPSGRVLARYRHDPRRAGSIGHDDVQALLEDRSGNLWVGTANGLDLLNRLSGEFLHYRHDERDAGSLRDSFVMSLYEDPTGLVWIGTRSGGVSRWNPHSWELGGRRPDWLAGKLVTAFAAAADRTVWVASLGGGLVRFDPESGERTGIDTLLGRPNAIGDARVMSLETDRQGALWIGTMASGLRRLRPDGGLDTFVSQPGDARGLSAPGIMAIHAGRDGRIWIGTHGGGANVLNPLTGRVQQLPYGGSAPGAVSAGNVTALAEDLHGNIWMGTDGGGLNLARPDGSVIKVYRHDPADPGSLSANTVYGITVDGDGRVWLGTDGGGLELVIGSSSAPEAVHFQSVSRANGLTSDTIYAVLVDAGGRLWLSGNSGLMRYDPRTRAVRTFHVEQGLQGEEFNFGAYRRLPDGRLCFGGPGGFNIFDPLRLDEHDRPPRVALLQVDVVGVPLPSPTPYWLLERIDVGSHATIVSLGFGALDFTSPKRNRLAYRMVDLSDRWIDLGGQHHVTLTNLDAGDHLLEVRAASADSVWSAAPLRLTIHKAPAPWRSPAAFAAYIAAALALAVLAAWRQKRSLAQAVAARERLEDEVASRTKDLRESNRLLEAAAQEKSAFLARMTHELRTPMNGVVGMTELLDRTGLSAAQARLTQTIRSSAELLLQIVNDLLDLSKAQAGKIELEAVPLDLVAILEESVALFAGAALGKGLDLTVVPPQPAPYTLVGDPLRIRQILLNLVGNAVKFTDRGHIVVEANVRPAGPGAADVEFAVSDTGIGMAPQAIEKIFEPFTQADESTSRRFGGTGLGLAICRELTQLMGGGIEVESRQGAGSTFRATLRLRCDAAAAQRAPVPARPVRIVTRRPALAEALSRHARALGLRVVDGGATEAGAAADDGALLILDASTHLDYLRAQLSVPEGRRRPLIVVASEAEAEGAGLLSLVGAAPVVGRPVQRADLERAIAAADAAAGTPAAAPFPAAATPVAAVGGHVLVVDDEPVNSAVAEGYLAELGCTSVAVADGAAALAQCAAQRFDLVLLDISMPVLDGFATAALLRQRPGPNQAVPVVALTAHDSAAYRTRCQAAGMNDLLGKPYTLAECAAMLERWVPRRAAAAAPGAALAGVDASIVAGLRNLSVRGPLDLYSRLVALFRTSGTQALDELRAALAAGDYGAARACCHKLRASAGNVGASGFAAALRELEQRCGEGDPAACQGLYARLDAAFPALLEELGRLTLRASA
ncbi:MAG TPA: two-component regulator propeller domain-containing protein [Steroidobacteraceae bacterium]|nr:two-component regulator propeller domain-containing protein [Steroidobacteraceae bacterium]